MSSLACSHMLILLHTTQPLFPSPPVLISVDTNGRTVSTARSDPNSAKSGDINIAREVGLAKRGSINLARHDGDVNIARSDVSLLGWVFVFGLYIVAIAKSFES